MNFRVFRAFFLREIRAAALGRFVHVFWGMALLAGWLPVWDDTDGAEVYILLQFCLYLVPLFSLLAGVGSAQNETEERETLLAQPIGATARVTGKFLALWIIVALAAVPLVLPSALNGGDLDGLIYLAAHAAAVGGIFAALGLAVGFSTADRSRAYLGGLCLWLLLLVGFDIVALMMAHSGAAEVSPQLWISLLMASPLDSLRVGALLKLGKIPFDITVAPTVGQWWLANPGLWFALLTSCWIAVSLAWAAWRLERRRR